MSKRQRQRTVSDQLRDVIENGTLSRYRLAKDAKVDASQLSRFIHGSGRLTTDSLDRIGKVLNLRIVSDLED